MHEAVIPTFAAYRPLIRPFGAPSPKGEGILSLSPAKAIAELKKLMVQRRVKFPSPLGEG